MLHHPARRPCPDVEPEAMGSIWSYLDITALGRQEKWEDSPEGYEKHVIVIAHVGGVPLEEIPPSNA